MSFPSTTVSGISTDEPIFSGWDDVLRFLDIVRILAWLLRLLRAILCGRKKEDTRPCDPAPCISRNEFGYINMNGAY